MLYQYVYRVSKKIYIKHQKRNSSGFNGVDVISMPNVMALGEQEGIFVCPLVPLFLLSLSCTVLCADLGRIFSISREFCWHQLGSVAAVWFCLFLNTEETKC